MTAMICPLTEEAYTRQLGHNSSVPLYHYRYFGTFPNMNPFDWLGAYHSSELPLVFGSYFLTEPSNSLFPYMAPTAEEAAVSEYIQGAWVAFAKDPANGLVNYDAWPQWFPGNSTNGLVELAVNDAGNATFVPSDSFVGRCGSLGFNVGP